MQVCFDQKSFNTTGTGIFRYQVRIASPTQDPFMYDAAGQSVIPQSTCQIALHSQIRPYLPSYYQMLVCRHHRAQWLALSSHSMKVHRSNLGPGLLCVQYIELLISSYSSKSYRFCTSESSGCSLDLNGRREAIQKMCAFATNGRTRMYVHTLSHNNQ